MDIDMLMNLINSCVFPIAMCVIMAWYVKYTTDKSQITIDKLSTAITELCSKIDILLDREESPK